MEVLASTYIHKSLSHLMLALYVKTESETGPCLFKLFIVSDVTTIVCEIDILLFQYKVTP